ncbi:hypothetical protein EIN_154860 [Entamoeba invadens IP1]|uniref:Metallo-beta-lactamase domain-containing protein n=1 Tax=Entamoeba invadens IP1 TaxID=370355 RepID=A0A0A1U939_ENTIV|nr:hypothetical protein EIN_154860 [Entamoeba invadens IP1]ELP91399.1 hypothetical protein EIN_154860 [Entamoeba invadens IP1]|eukprot:XP_004258170.1 hypothetical protein EIN_154860 [Entamoeba invadens IP1]
MSLTVRVLGCGGNLGMGNQTTSFMVYKGDYTNETDIALIDGGTGLTRLSLEDIKRVKDIAITHSHIDHITGMCLLVEAFWDETLTLSVHPTLHCSSLVLKQMEDTIFKPSLWMNLIERKFYEYNEIEDGETHTLTNGITITAIKVKHSTLTFGYIVSNESSSFAFTADTCYYEPFWVALFQVKNLKAVISEVSLQNSLQDRCDASCHMCPNYLQKGLQFLDKTVKVYASHIKTYCWNKVCEELKQLDREVIILHDEMVLHF